MYSELLVSVFISAGCNWVHVFIQPIKLLYFTVKSSDSSFPHKNLREYYWSTTPRPLLCVHRDPPASGMHCVTHSSVSSWLQPCHLWEPAYLTAYKQKTWTCKGIIVSHHTSRQRRTQTGHYKAYSFAFFLLAPSMKKRQRWGFWLMVNLLWSQNQSADKCFFPWQCFVLEDELSLSADLCFPCCGLPASVIPSVWVLKKEALSDIMIPLQLSTIVSLIIPRNPTIRKDKLVTIRR